jgi:hypothetical protein
MLPSVAGDSHSAGPTDFRGPMIGSVADETVPQRGGNAVVSMVTVPASSVHSVILLLLIDDCCSHSQFRVVAAAAQPPPEI